MSIYPVKLAEWFPKTDTDNHDTMKMIVKFHTCHVCNKKKMDWRRAIGHHSIPWGYGDIWCGVRCYRKGLKR